MSMNSTGFPDSVRPGVKAIYDLSATPFFLKGSGYAEGTLFPWTMSDFSLMDAIECGIVKLPRVPVAENIPGDDMPMFRNLWENIRKDMPKKDLGSIAMSYGNIYVAQVAYGANMTQLVRALHEAEAYPGPSLTIAYAHCIEHGIDMTSGTDLHKDAVESGFWPLYRFNPALAAEGKNPLQLDSKTPSKGIEEFMYKQNRFRVLRQADPKRAEQLLQSIRQDVATRWKYFEQMAALDL